MKLWSITVVYRLWSSRRVHSARRMIVLAETALAAVQRYKDEYPDEQHRVEVIREPVQCSPVYTGAHLYFTKDEVRQMKGLSKPEARAPKPRALSDRPLGETQRSVLCSVREHGSWSINCGWYWNNDSGTRKILDSLYQRCLVDRSEGRSPTYTINDEGRKALAAKH
jgi:hypothetical protein